MNPRILLAKSLFRLGDCISYPMIRHDIGWLYRVYAKLMNMSAALDNAQAIWGKPRCFVCDGSGLDPDHHWPDGTQAHCEVCDGYGNILTHEPLDP